MTITLEYTSEKALKALLSHPTTASVGARKGLTYLGKFFVRTASNAIKDRTKKTGRVYRHRSRRHRASAPGEYPANKSGALRRGLGFSVRDVEELQFGNRLKKPYPSFVELGTSRMKPRSYLKRTIEDNEVKAANIVGEEIQKALTKI